MLIMMKILSDDKFLVYGVYHYQYNFNGEYFPIYYLFQNKFMPI